MKNETITVCYKLFFLQRLNDEHIKKYTYMRIGYIFKVCLMFVFTLRKHF